MGREKGDTVGKRVEQKGIRRDSGRGQNEEKTSFGGVTNR